MRYQFVQSPLRLDKYGRLSKCLPAVPATALNLELLSALVCSIGLDFRGAGVPGEVQIATWRALGRILEPPWLLQASWSALGGLLERHWMPLGSLLEASGAENKCT